MSQLGQFAKGFGFREKVKHKEISYHWMIDNKLAAITGGVIYVWSSEKWTKLKTKFPLKKQPKLFEDNEFVIFRDCHGEFGGTIYFFDKTSGEIYFTESTCANSVFKRDGKYLVLSHLGHGSGSSELKSIENPRKLTKAKKKEINKAKEGEALGYTDKSEAYEELLDFYGIQIFSTFRYDQRQLCVIHLNELTFLAEINGTEIEIVHPLFDNDIYTHDPVTTTYGNYTLMNLDFYGTALDKDVSVIIIDQNGITKVDWNENQSR